MYMQPFGRLSSSPLVLAAVVVAICVLVYEAPLFEGYRTDVLGSTNQPRRPTIFVSVASYRDSECSKTIQELFGKAKYPERVFVGVCEQNSDDPSERCSGKHDTKYDKQIRTIRVPHTEAKGPCVARYACSTLFGQEDFFCQIDSHMIMVPDWDEKAVAEINACPDPTRSIISMYPNDYGTYTVESKEVPVMCKAKFGTSHGLPIFEAAMKQPSWLGNAPRPNAFIAAGFLFASGDFPRLVPYDPHLKQLFQGEEILLSARAWTSGFDIFSSRVNITLHHYLREDKPKFWNDKGSEYEAEKAASERRARQLLGLEQPPLTSDKYGMGHVRTLDEYWKFAGVDPINKTATKSFCT